MTLFIRYAFAPLVLVASFGVGIAALNHGWDTGLVLTSLTVGIAALLMFLESHFPFREEWRASSGGFANSLAHALVGTALGGAVGFALAARTSALFVTPTSVHLWPSRLPFALQLVLAFLIVDLGRYVQHRILHRWPLAWRFHLLHHDVNALGVLVTARAHFVERVTQQFFLFLPLMLLGADPIYFFFYSLSGTVLGLFAHANIDTRWGLLNYIFMTPPVHRLHHAVAHKEGNSNFGDLLVVWDHAFGTWVAPMTENTTLPVGVEHPQRGTFLQECLRPFTRSKSSN